MMQGARPRVLLIAPLSFDYSPDANAIQQPLQLGRRFDTTLVVPPGVTPPPEIAAACTVKAAGSRTHGERGWRLSFLWGALDTAKASAGQGRWVVAGTSDQFGATAACRVARSLGAPWIWLCWDHPFGSRFRHGRLVSRLERRVRTGLLRRTLRRAHALALMFAPEGLAFLRLPEGLAVAVDNGVLNSRLLQCREAARKQPGLVVAVGGLSRDKGADLILGAFEIVATREPSARLRLLGALDPAFRQEYEERIRQAPLAGRVEWRGDLPFDAAMGLAAEAEVGLCAYRPLEWLQYNEVLKVGEYQALGVVPVAHDLPGTRRLVRDGRDGRLVPAGDPRAMAEAILTILADGALRTRLASAGIEAARGRDWDIVGEKVANLVRRAAATGSAAHGAAVQ